MRNHRKSSRWQGLFEALGFGRRSERAAAAQLKRDGLRFEPLEDRHLLSVLCWDPQQSGGTNLGGAGTWANGTALWYNPATHTDVAWNNANGDTAVFDGTAGAVTIGSGVTAGGIDFETDGYALSGAAITLTTNTDSGWSDGEIRVTGSTTAAAIDAVLSGSVGLTKTGEGALTLTGAGDFSDRTAIRNGTLAISGDDDRLPTGTTVTSAMPRTRPSASCNWATGRRPTIRRLPAFTPTAMGATARWSAARPAIRR